MCFLFDIHLFFHVYQVFVGMFDPKRYEFKLTEVKRCCESKENIEPGVFDLTF